MRFLKRIGWRQEVIGLETLGSPPPQSAAQDGCEIPKGASARLHGESICQELSVRTWLASSCRPPSF